MSVLKSTTEVAGHEIALASRKSKFNDIESQIVEKERRYRTLFEQSINPVFLATHQLTLTSVNQSFTELTGYGDKYCSLLSLEKLFADSNEYQIFFNTLKENARVKDYAACLISKNTEKKQCLLNCVEIADSSSEFPSYQGIIQDLTMRNQAEADVLQSERLSLTGQIARIIAHEVRNPLTSLNLALDQLRDEIPVQNKVAKIYSDIIKRSAYRIELLVNEMLDSSRPTELSLALNNIDEIMTDTVSLALDRLQLNNMQLRTNYGDNLPRILVDKEKIQIALLNIIINAIEAMIPGEGILRIDSSQKDKIVTIAIADNGKGISGTDQGKLFDPFFTNKYKGMGLGLTLVKNILASHSAQILVKSELQKGTTFYVKFTVV
jgi:PAS domain S-box-containing protein